MNEQKEPRGIRNNNPLNLRIGNNWKGLVKENTDGEFDQFEEMEWGIRAALIVIHNYMSLYDLKTLQKIIERWAPSSDGNNPKHYAELVARNMGCDVTTKPRFNSPLEMLKMIDGMIRVECGKVVDDFVIIRGYALACTDLGVKPYLSELKTRDPLAHTCYVLTAENYEKSGRKSFRK